MAEAERARGPEVTVDLAVVGAGVAGLAAARAARALSPAARVVVLERSGRAGGLVETERTDDGLLVEHGADCLVTTKPEGLRALGSLGLADAIVPGSAKQSFIAAGGALVPLPSGLFTPSWTAASAILRSPLFSAQAKARILAEPLVPQRAGTEDESVASFVRRRFGAELLERAIGPLLSLIHGTPMERLSLQAALPRLAEIEREHGNVSWGLARENEKRRASAPKAAAPAHTPMISLRRGMATLTDAMASSLDGAIQLGVTVSGLERRRDGSFRLTLADQGSLDARAVIVAVPAHVATRLLEDLDPDLAAMLGDVRHSRLDTVTMAWPRSSIPHPMNGTGFVVADGPARAITGCSWPTESWPDRAPDGVATLRCFASSPAATDAELVRALLADLRDLMGVEVPPTHVVVRRREQVLPEYEVGCMLRIAAMRARAAQHGPFALAGNAHGGVGIPDCIRSGEAAVRGLLPWLAEPRDDAGLEAARRPGARLQDLANPQP